MAVTTALVGNLLHIVITNPPVNAISSAVRTELITAVNELNNSAAHAALLYAEGKTFIAGADIREMGKPDKGPLLPDVMLAYRTSSKPVVACLHGTPRGGGVELAMACHARVALQNTTLGLPEVAIGLVPGSGGTQCLPRLVDTRFAVDMITSAKAVTANEAHEHGLLDAVFKSDLITEATEWINSKLRLAGANPVLTDKLDEAPAVDTLDSDEWSAIENQLLRKTKGQPAPIAALQLIRIATQSSLAEGLQQEREVFLRMRDSSESRALRHLFFAERACAKPVSLNATTAKPLETKHIGVVGGGLMGTGISTALLNAHIKVTLIDLDRAAAEKGQQRIAQNLAAAVKRGLITAEQASTRNALLSINTDYSALNHCDLVIEAVFEDLSVKQAVFRELDKQTHADTILATNTSYLDIDAIASVTSRPESVVGLHFFSPAHIMKLLEIVRTDKTSDQVLKTSFALAKKIRKIPVLAGMCEGFIGNRILKAYRFQAEVLLEEGCLPKQVDDAMTALGFPMGPFVMQDLAGLDISWAVRKANVNNRDQNAHYVTIADQLCELGRYGQKAGAGWYRYDEGDSTPHHDPDVDNIIMASSPQNRRDINVVEIQSRILATMTNEGAQILSENIAERPLDIDVVMVNGYGFPRHLGGPMQHADEQGLSSVLSAIDGIAVRYPNNIQPAPMIQQLISQEKQFTSLN